MYGLRGLGDTGCGNPVVVNGSPYATQCYSYDVYLSNPDAFYNIAGAQETMAVRLYDPSGVKPNVDFQPTDDAIAVLKAHGVPVQAKDQGVSYEYGFVFQKLFAANWNAGGNKTTLDLESDTVQQLLSQGWTRTQLAPWLNDIATHGAASDPAYQNAVAAQIGLPNTATADEAAVQNLVNSGGWLTAPASTASSPAAIDPALASALSAPTGIMTSPPVAAAAATASSAVAVTPAVSNNALLIGGLAVVGILIMMSTGGKS